MALLLQGCAYDYLNHADRVSYRAGNAVDANLEQSTKNPTKSNMYSTSGLGKDGNVIPADNKKSDSTNITINTGSGG